MKIIKRGKKPTELTGGLYECATCGHIVEITSDVHLLRYGVRASDRDTALFRCPRCYYQPQYRNLETGPNTFHRIGFWRTLKYVARGTWEEIQNG